MANRKEPKRVARPAAPSISLTNGWAAVVLALLTVLFFHEVIVGGKTLLSPDATAPAGFVRVGEQVLYQERVYPLWNPYIFLGMPSFGSGMYNPLIYPPDWPLALLQKVLPLPELTWMLAYYFLGGFFLFLLAREWGARPEGALLGASAFVFAPNLIAVGSHGHGSQLVSSAYIPLLLWLTARWLRRGGLSNLAWLAVAGGFQLLRGHVQICFYAWLAVGLYTAVEWIAGLVRPGARLTVTGRAVGVAAAALLAFGLSGLYSLPLRDYAPHSIRGGGGDGGVGLPYATQWSLAPYELPAMVVPGWAGFGGTTYWGAMPFTDYPNAYLGLVPVLLAVPAFFGTGPARIFALLLASLALAIAFGRYTPVYEFLYQHLPLFNKFRVPVMVVVLLQVAAGLGVAWGWSTLLGRREGPPQRARTLDRMLLIAAAVVAAVLVVGVLGQDAWRSRYVAGVIAVRAAENLPFSADLAAIAYRGFVSDLGRAGILGLLALGAAWLAHRARISASVPTVVALVLVAFELWPVSGRVMLPVLSDPVQRNLELGRDDVVDFLERAGPRGSFRILPLQDFQSNRFAGFAIPSLGGYHAAKPRLVQDLLEADLADNLAWRRLLGIRFVVSSRPIEPLPAYMRPAFEGTGYVYENLLALPRATVVGEYRVVNPARAILDSVRTGTSETSVVTFLEQDPGLTLGPVEGARAEIVSYGLNEVVIRAETPGPGLVRLADMWYPDWTATVDGEPAPVLKADYLLRAVPVPAGTHEVVFRFRSAAVRRGLMLSLGSLGVLLLLFAAAWRRRRAAAAKEDGAPEVA